MPHKGRLDAAHLTLMLVGNGVRLPPDPKVQQRTPYICTDSVGGGWVANLVESHGGFQTRRQMEPRAKRTARRDGRFCQYHPCRRSPTTLSGRDLCGKDAQSFTKNKPLTCHCWTLNPCGGCLYPGTASGSLWPLPGHSWPLLAISWTLLAPLDAPWPLLITSGPSLAASGCSWPLLFGHRRPEVLRAKVTAVGFEPTPLRTGA